MKNVQLTQGLVFASHVVFKEVLKKWCNREKYDYEYENNDMWRVTAKCKKTMVGRYMHPKYKWEMPFKSNLLRAYVCVARIIRIVELLQGGWLRNIWHSFGMIILG